MGENSWLVVVGIDNTGNLLAEQEMSWRWRKIFRWGAGSISISKAGVGWSIGFGILRYGVNPYGRRYISIGIPGTGLYFWRYLDRSRDKGQQLGESEGTNWVSHSNENSPDAQGVEEIRKKNLELLKKIQNEGRD